MHQVHAPGAVGGVIADQNGTGVDNAALGDAYHKKGRCQQRHCAGQPHDGVAHRIADGQQQHTAFHAQRTGQHPHQQPCQQVAHAHQGEQCTGHAVGKAVALLQQTDHHTRTDGTDAAEEKGRKARIAQARVLLFHGVPLLAEISFFLFNHFFAALQPDFLTKSCKKPAGLGRFKMPSACALGIIQGNILLDFGRTERLRAFRSTIFTRKVAEMRCIFPSQPLS